LPGRSNKAKYVNMADVISSPRKDPRTDRPRGRKGPPRDVASPSDDLYRYVEAMFFAYRDFISEPDRILDEIGFGRAHHRVLHFVHRYPGMRVAGLLDILQITKQSLARVLRELIKEGYVTQKSGVDDKRERLLYVTGSGAALAERLAAPQLERVRAALDAVPTREREAIADFLAAMIGAASGALPWHGRAPAPEGETAMGKE
jgi:DNA-binding MarR family transcriptional regulator